MSLASVDFKLAAEIFSSILGLTSTYMLTKGDGRGWGLGALMSFFSAYVFFSAKLYGSFLIQLLFLAIQLTGLWRWKRGANKDLRQTARRMTRWQILQLAAVWGLIALVSGYVSQMNGGSLPYLDGLCTGGNVLAQLTLMAGFPECWIIYMITNTCYIGMNYMSQLYAYTILYSVYMSVAYRGWRQWTEKQSKPL
jgi:nicotinamide mononucleotide transporter